jgi:hypothetical protein
MYAALGKTTGPGTFVASNNSIAARKAGVEKKPVAKPQLK